MIKHISMMALVIIFGMLGIFVNPYFYFGIMLICPLMHLIVGCSNNHSSRKKRKKYNHK